ncbi:MAG: GntR family transcriptional regulator [Paracoccaceae bacterium]
MPMGWQDVRDEALRRIQAREWPPGDPIPNEADLADELGCARGTVNRALRDLAEAGWLDRRRKAGTRVRAAPSRRAQLAIPLIRQEVEARGQTFAHTVIARKTASMPARERALLGTLPEDPAQHVQTLYLADGQPYAFEDRWVHLPGTPGFAEASLDTLSPNEWLVQHAPFSRGTLDYGAALAPDYAAAHLNCPSDAPVMVLDRCTFGPETAVTAVRVIYAPGYRLRMQI